MACRMDRLWPDPCGQTLPAPCIPQLDGRYPSRAAAGWIAWCGLNMLTSIDGRAQLRGTAEGLGGRTDRRLLQLYRAAYDAIGSGAGTLRADDFYPRSPRTWLTVARATGRSAQPLALLIGGGGPLPTERRWFANADPEPRGELVIGSTSPHAVGAPGTETWVAPGPRPEPAWILERLAAERHTLLPAGGRAHPQRHLPGLGAHRRTVLEHRRTPARHRRPPDDRAHRRGLAVRGAAARGPAAQRASRRG